MVFIVETGSGTPGANSFCTSSFVTAYLTDRARLAENDWATAGTTRQQQACVAATDFIEARWGLRFKGTKALALVAGREASGLLTLSALPLDGSTLTVGQKVYRLVNALAEENDVLIGATIAETVQALADAINLGSEAGTTFEEHTLQNYEAMGLVQDDVDLVVVARTKGENGNLIAFESDIVGATLDPATDFLEGGLDEGEQPLSFPRSGLYTRDGRPVLGVPLKVKQATAEYAVRSLAAVLMPDPTYDASLVGVESKREVVGPIEEETHFIAGAVPTLTVAYPAADRLLAEYVTAGGGAVRA
jgi:hypothetical protein